MSKSRNAQEREQERQAAIAKLRELLKPGDTVYTILRHASRSGLSRVYDVIAWTPDGPFPIGWLIARAIDSRWDGVRGGIPTTATAFEIVSHAAWAAFEDDPRLAAWQANRPAHASAHPQYSLTARDL